MGSETAGRGVSSGPARLGWRPWEWAKGALDATELHQSLRHTHSGGALCSRLFRVVLSWGHGLGVRTPNQWVTERRRRGAGMTLLVCSNPRDGLGRGTAVGAWLWPSATGRDMRS